MFFNFAISKEMKSSVTPFQRDVYVNSICKVMDLLDTSRQLHDGFCRSKLLLTDKCK